MRGFPLLNTLAILLFFAVAWGPVKALTGARPADTVAGGEDAGAAAAPGGEGLTLVLSASHALERLRVEHLGEVVWELAEAPVAGAAEQHLGEIEIPPEGIDFWIEATFGPGAAEPGQRGALGIEVVPDAVEREPRQKTLWAAPGDRQVSDLAVFQWPRPEDGEGGQP